MASRNKNYDVVIIGSGMGGLITGAYLVKKGIKVLILEQHSQPGGYFTSFNRKGYVFNGGIQACEDCGMLFSVFRQIGVLNRIDFYRTKFALATPDHFSAFESLDEVCNFYRHLIKVYPEDEEGIVRIINDIQVFSGVLGAYCQIPNPLFGSWLETVFRYRHWRKEYRDRLVFSREFSRHLSIPFGAYLEERLRNPDLKRFLLQMMYQGSPAAFALIFPYFVMDYYLPRGGFQKISDALASFIIEKGGEIRYRTLVSRILFKEGKAVGVELADGENIPARFVVSNGDARRTFLEMLPAEATSHSFRRRLRETPVSESVFTVFLGVDMPADKIQPLTKDCSHIYFMPDYQGVSLRDSLDDEEYYRKAPVEICLPSLHDFSMAPPGKSVVILQSLALKDYAKNWGTANGERNEKYRDLKEKVTEYLITSAEKIIPGLRDKIEIKLSATPLTNERFTLNSEGATAGWTYDPTRAFNSGWKGMWGFKTPVKNLYLVGHWTMSPGGAPACFMSGRLVSSLISWKMRFRM